MKQVLFNLLSNAVKFTPDRGKVGVNVRRANGAVQVAVWDTGIGIALEDQERIFEEFQQVGHGLTGKTEGTGLGLTLTKKFVELHGGALSVESAPGRGSTFTVTLPVGSPPTDTAPAGVGDHGAKEWVGRAGARPLVLVVEDDPRAAELIRIHLTEAGYACEVAGDGAEGLAMVTRLRPHAIVLYVLLPEVDRWPFLTEIKADAATSDIPVIIASVVDEKGKAFALGAADYLLKPIRQADLLTTLRSVGVVVRGTPMTVLAIDDDPTTLELLAAVLEPEGFRVLRARTGEQGVEVAKSEQPDIVILDLLMPGIDGFHVLDCLEQSPVTQGLPIVIFTVKQLTAEDKRRLRGRVVWLAQKQEFSRQSFVGTIRGVLERTLGGRADV